MAIFQLSRTVVNWTTPRRVSKIASELHGLKFKQGLFSEGVLIPDCAPAWVVQRYGLDDAALASVSLWRDVEAREWASTQRRKAQFALRFGLALPVELPFATCEEVTRRFAREFLMANGEVVDFVCFDRGDGNPYVHLLQTMRYLGDDGFGLKIRNFMGKRGELLGIRAGWAGLLNEALALSGSDARVDHRAASAVSSELSGE